MFARYSANPSAETVTLEVIGTATGIFKFGGENRELSRDTANNVADLSSRVSTLLRKRQPMPADMRDFLVKAQEQLGQLAIIPSAKRLNIIDIKTKQPWLEGNAKFQQRLSRFRNEIGPLAQAVYDQHFLEPARAIADKYPNDLDGLEREKRSVRFGVSIGREMKRF